MDNFNVQTVFALDQVLKSSGGKEIRWRSPQSFHNYPPASSKDQTNFNLQLNGSAKDSLILRGIHNTYKKYTKRSFTNIVVARPLGCRTESIFRCESLMWLQCPRFQSTDITRSPLLIGYRRQRSQFQINSVSSRYTLLFYFLHLVIDYTPLIRDITSALDEDMAAGVHSDTYSALLKFWVCQIYWPQDY